MRFNAVSHIRDFNLFRIKTGKSSKSFSLTTLRDGLQSCGLPLNSLFINELRKSGILIKVSKEEYMWENPNTPIHFKILQTVYFNYHNKISFYNSVKIAKIKSSPESKNEKIRKAIKFLKNEGYEIFMPLTNIYTKL